MKLPLSLLKEFIDTALAPVRIAETLTLLGIEVDAVLHPTPPFTGVVVGEVLSVRPHPNAEKLQIAEVSDGKGVHQIVCGASNCRAGIKTAFATIGATLPDPSGNPFSIKAAKLRGVESFGMLCAISELMGVEDQSSGILELPLDLEPGQNLLKLIWDPVFELSLTPNLGYCLSAKGVARELSASLNIPLKLACLEKFPAKRPCNMHISVERSDLCPRYIGQMIKQVTIKASPFWLEQTLKAAGIRPINNAVDITNYILLKWGQPMHAFDADLVEGNSINVSLAKKPFSFLCLDQIEREVPEGSLLICDSQKPVALAGVMGGANSAVSEKTQNIFLEAAFFDPTSIRNTSKKMGLRSESSLRFEKGIDPDAMMSALEEALKLFETLCEARIESASVDHYPKLFSPKKISCRSSRVQNLLGCKISLHEIGEIFERLGFTASLQEKDTWLVSIPPYRFDVQEEIDLVEEVARIYGYNAIDRKRPLYTTTSLPHDPAFLFERQLRERLISLGLQEVITADLISPKLSELAIEERAARVQFLQVLHAKSEDYSILRPSLLPGFLQTVQYNMDQKNPSFEGFEIGRIYFEEKGKNIELSVAGIFLTGKTGPQHWDQKPPDTDFYDLKGLLENLFEALKVSDISYSASKHPSFHPGQQASIYLKGQLIGSFGQVHPTLLQPLDIRQSVLYAELLLSPLLAAQKPFPIMQPIPLFPSSERDWTIALPKNSSVQPILDALHGFQSPLLEKVELIDLFVSESQNATFRFTYRSLAKTICFEEVEAEHARMMQIVLASLR
ncbi:MAG: phenylalanine--tRNA ligase subunit beta [Chlamydiae bacterium]|nr:phenylalanine--tRNA ligase subunit beta [Chlamydiota bacterium]